MLCLGASSELRELLWKNVNGRTKNDLIRSTYVGSVLGPLWLEGSNFSWYALSNSAFASRILSSKEIGASTSMTVCCGGCDGLCSIARGPPREGAGIPYCAPKIGSSNPPYIEEEGGTSGRGVPDARVRDAPLNGCGP